MHALKMDVKERIAVNDDISTLATESLSLTVFLRAVKDMVEVSAQKPHGKEADFNHGEALCFKLLEEKLQKLNELV